MPENLFRREIVAGRHRIIEAWVDTGILGQWIETCKSIPDFISS